MSKMKTGKQDLILIEVIIGTTTIETVDYFVSLLLLNVLALLFIYLQYA